MCRILLLVLLSMLAFPLLASSDLIDAATRGDTETVEQLLERDANTEAKNDREQTAIMIVAIWGNTEIVELLQDAL